MVRPILLHLGVFLLYSIFASAALLLLPPLAGAAAGFLIFWIAVRYCVPPPSSAAAVERHERLRLQPLRGPVLGWTTAAVPVLWALTWSLGEVYVGLVPVPPRIINPFGPLVLDPARSLLIAVFAIAFAPVVEELFFRGLIQGRLESRWGAWPAITATALLFAGVHIDTLPWVVPLHVVLGVLFGWVVYATGSLWAGVVLHAANNAAAVWGLTTADEPLLRPTIWETGPDARWWISVAMLLATIPVAAIVARRLWRASRL